MSSVILLGHSEDGEVFRWGEGATADDGETVTLIALSEVLVPQGWWGEALYRTATVIINSNVGIEARLTPVIAGLKLDGQGGRPDSRVAFTIPTPDTGERVLTRYEIGLFRPFANSAGAYGKLGLRGTWVQFLLETTSAPTLPAGETLPDCRFEGIEVDLRPSGNTQPTVGPT